MDSGFDPYASPRNDKEEAAAEQEHSSKQKSAADWVSGGLS